MSKPMEVVDDRGRKYRLPGPPARIVSLVPSDTYTLSRLGGGKLLVGRTKYCVEPAEEVANVEEVGGTKDPDLDRIIALAPDLVLMNKEENTERAVEKLEEARIRAFVTFPRRVEDGIALVARIARLLGDPTPATKEIVREAYRIKQSLEAPPAGDRPKVFVPIWMDPLMTVHGDTYVSSMLAAAGAENAFADRRRAYPLAADVGDAPALDASKTEGRDTRYPRITMAEVEARAPDVILLPNEPHAFTEEDRKLFLATNTPAAKQGRVYLCDGRDLMWPGLRSLEGLERVRTLIRASATA